MQLLYTALWCALATFFFAFLLRSPVRVACISAVIGAAGYVLYSVLCSAFASQLPGYFFATLLISVCGELCARIMKTPATLFISAAVIPLVPGTGLYRMMAYFVSGDFAAAGSTGTLTVEAIGVMAAAIALNAFFFRSLRRISR